MKVLIGLIVMIGISTTLTARNIYNVDYIHPRSEPKGLYIVSFQYDNLYYQYRVYCPKADVRNITNDRWGKTRKAYKEDRVQFRNKRVLREAVDYVCGY